MYNIRQEMQAVVVNYYQIFGTFNIPTQYSYRNLIVGVGKSGADINWSMGTCQGGTRLELP